MAYYSSFSAVQLKDDLILNSKQPDIKTFLCSLKKSGKKSVELCECAQLIFNCAVEGAVETGR